MGGRDTERQKEDERNSKTEIAREKNWDKQKGKERKKQWSRTY